MVRVKVPATTANMGPGFDTLGMALDLYNTVEMKEIPEGLIIQVEGYGADEIPKDESNLVFVVAKKIFDLTGYQPQGLFIKLNNEVPVASGLGSSATAIVGGIVAANVLAGSPLSTERLLEIACDIEGHPDNVAPALLGGIVVATMDSGKVYKSLIVPPAKLSCVVAIPKFPLATRESRGVLPKEIPFKDAVFNVGRSSLLIAALSQGDLELLSIAMQDKLHQPYRCQLVPGMNEVFSSVLASGAKGVALSGAGPTLIAFTDDRAKEIVQVMEAGFQSVGVESLVLIVKPTLTGAIGIIQEERIES